MFKYPSPWQVLCNLEKRDLVVSVNGEGGSSSLQETDLSTDSKEHCVTDAAHTTAESSTKYPFTGSSDADLNQEPQEAICKPAKLIAIVSETHTRRESIVVTTDIQVNEERTPILEEQRPDSTDSQPSSTTPESSMDRVTRNLIFSLSSPRSIGGSRENLTDAINEESRLVDKRKDVWIPPPDRSSKLKVLKEKERFEIRSHRPETIPSKLFVDSDGEDDGKTGARSREFTPEKVSELEKERRDIIKKQGQRKSLDLEDLLTLQDETDSPLPIKELNESGGLTTTDINTEQINFEAARQQFIMLEKKRNSLPITPHPQSRTPWRSSQSLYENDRHSDFKKQNVLEQDVKTYKTEPPVVQQVNGRERSSSLLRKQFFRDLSVDTVDAIDTREQEKTSDDVHSKKAPQMVPEVKECIPMPSDETPIEREIRLALEREENLRRERGIQFPVDSNEMVEIQKNPVLSVSSETQVPKKSKDRSRTSLYLQREIEKEAQREADLKNEGKVVGLYDKGSARELDERKKLFEVPDESPVQQQKIITKTTSTAMIAEEQDNTHQVDSGQSSDNSKGPVVDLPLPYSVRTNWKPKPLNAYRSRRLSSDNILDVKRSTETSTVEENSEEALVLSKENVQVQPSKSRLHVQEDSMVNRKEEKLETNPEAANHVERYNTRLRPSHSSVIQEEIRQALERDRELQEQRRKSDHPYASSQQTTQVETYDQYEKPSLSTDVSNPWAPASWKNTSSSSSVSTPTTPVQMFKPRQYPKFEFTETHSGSLKKHEYWYAGISPSDAVNTEIVESTRVNRHKSRMALLWEAGLYANEPRD